MIKEEQLLVLISHILDNRLQMIKENTNVPVNSKFVIQDHHASHHHYDLRIKKGNVLVSWAIPKAKIPHKTSEHVLAVQTEDHPLYWYDFQGTIPKDEYGAGTVKIYDRGPCVIYKWTNNTIIVKFNGRKVRGFYALVKTHKDEWLLIRMNQEKAVLKYGGE